MLGTGTTYHEELSLGFVIFFFPLRKYPVIHTDDDRERYKAVFQDQFSEYKELSAEVQAILRKFDELDAVMSRLPHHSANQQVGVGGRPKGRVGVSGLALRIPQHLYLLSGKVSEIFGVAEQHFHSSQ